jgi:hypothetical protein
LSLSSALAFPLNYQSLEWDEAVENKVKKGMEKVDEGVGLMDLDAA